MSISIAMTKGRLEKETIKLLDKANFGTEELKNKGRKLVFNDTIEDIKYFLVKAADSITYVEHGVADIGVVGKDTLMESDNNYYEVLDLEIGKCNFIVASLPEKDVFKKVGHIKIGTKYPKVAREYFKKRGMDVEINKAVIEGDLTEEEIKSEVLKELKLEGLLLDDVKVVKAMDNTLEPGTHSLIIPANMKKAGDLGKNKALITMEQFELLRKYVNEKMIEICQNMIEGKIDIEPCKENKNIVCDYCNYSHICQFDSSLEDNRYKVIPKKKEEDIWKSINEKVGGEVNGD